MMSGAAALAQSPRAAQHDRMTPPAPSPAEIQRIARAGVPLAETWGVEVLEAEPGRAVCRLPRRAELLRPGGVVSGPAIMGLADIAVWAALLAASGGRDESLTAAMQVNFLSAAGPGPLLAEARLIKPRGRLLFAEVLIRRNDSPHPVAHVTATWAARASS
jgi:uncharacterized protein (TIGR00369 family)